MKDRVIQFLLGIILSVTGLMLTITFAIEEPSRVGENYALLIVAVINSMWLIPYSIFYIKKRNLKEFYLSILIYALCVFPIAIYRLYNTPFESLRWKTEINNYMIYDKNPAHANWKMVADIIDSEMLLGLSIKELEGLLGKNYYTKSEETDTTFAYYYSHGTFYDGCDKLMVTLHNGCCTNAKFGGCD